MYKIIQPSKEDKLYFGQKQVQQIQELQDESFYDDISQIPSQLQKEELEQMLDLKIHLVNSKLPQNQKNIDLWKSIQQIEMRIQEQERNFLRINQEHQQEIKKLKNELNQQKHLYETKIEEIKQSRIQSSNSQVHSPYSLENNKEYNYRSNNNYFEVSQEKNYLQQLVQDLKQQIQVLQTKSYVTPYQNDIKQESKYKQLEQQDKTNIERICHLETQMINQKLFYENDISKLKKQLDEQNQEEIILRNQIQQLQQDLNNYKNKFNQVLFRSHQKYYIINFLIKNTNNLLFKLLNNILVTIIIKLVILILNLLTIQPLHKRFCPINYNIYKFKFYLFIQYWQFKRGSYKLIGIYQNGSMSFQKKGSPNSDFPPLKPRVENSINCLNGQNLAISTLLMCKRQRSSLPWRLADALIQPLLRQQRKKLINLYNKDVLIQFPQMGI